MASPRVVERSISNIISGDNDNGEDDYDDPLCCDDDDEEDEEEQQQKSRNGEPSISMLQESWKALADERFSSPSSSKSNDHPAGADSTTMGGVMMMSPSTTGTASPASVSRLGPAAFKQDNRCVLSHIPEPRHSLFYPCRL